MSRAEHTVVIHRPAADVFAFLTDLDTAPLWQPTVLDVQRLSDGPMAVGFRFREVRRFLGRNLTSTLEVTEFTAPHRSAVQIVEGPVVGTASYALRAVADATELRCAYRLDAAGVLSITEPLATRLIVREFEANLGHLKDLLEARVHT